MGKDLDLATTLVEILSGPYLAVSGAILVHVENSMLDLDKNLIGLLTRFNESRPDLASELRSNSELACVRQA